MSHCYFIIVYWKSHDNHWLKLNNTARSASVHSEKSVLFFRQLYTKCNCKWNCTKTEKINWSQHIDLFFSFSQSNRCIAIWQLPQQDTMKNWNFFTQFQWCARGMPIDWKCWDHWIPVSIHIWAYIHNLWRQVLPDLWINRFGNNRFGFERNLNCST